MNKTLYKYLGLTFGISWVLQIAGSICYRNGSLIGFQLLVMASMFGPLLSSWLCGAGMKGIGWKPRFKGNWKAILTAFFMPAVVSVLGAALYFLLFPKALDLSLPTLNAQIGEEGVAQMASVGLTPQLYLLVSAVQAVTWAPIINMIPAVGEEAGWRGVMYPMLKERFGRNKGRLVGGIIWGAWHWPVMILAGYEYGFDYFGAPILGLFLFCVVTVVFGFFLDILYEKTRCIWVPALAHGAFNAATTIPVYMVSTEYANWQILGPGLIGMIGILPLAVLVAVMVKKEMK